MNKRDIIRKQFKAFYFSRQLGAFEDAAKERTMHVGISLRPRRWMPLNVI
jgi:hypothetical protein